MNLQKDIGKVFNVLCVYSDQTAIECPAVLVGFVAGVTPVFVAVPRSDGFHSTKEFAPVNLAEEAWRLLKPALTSGTAKVIVVTEGFHYAFPYLEKYGNIDSKMYTLGWERYNELYDYARHRLYGLTALFTQVEEE